MDNGLVKWSVLRVFYNVHIAVIYIEVYVMLKLFSGQVEIGHC